MDDKELVKSALALADKFYAMHGHISRPDFKFYESKHPTEQLMWSMACEAFNHTRGSDVMNALDEIMGDE